MSVPQPTSFWQFEESSGTRFDSTPTGNNLTDNNTVGQGTGKVGFCCDFEQSNSEYLSINNNSSLQVGDDDFSFCFWVNFEALNSIQGLFSKYNFAGGQPGFNSYFFAAGGGLTFLARDFADTSTVSVVDPLTVSTGTWI